MQGLSLFATDVCLTLICKGTALKRQRRLSAISAIFAKYAIFAEIATFQRAPLPSHLSFCLQFGDFGDLSAISAIFVKYIIFAKIATLQRALFPSHLNFSL